MKTDSWINIKIQVRSLCNFDNICDCASNFLTEVLFSVISAGQIGEVQLSCRNEKTVAIFWVWCHRTDKVEQTFLRQNWHFFIWLFLSFSYWYEIVLCLKKNQEKTFQLPAFHYLLAQLALSVYLKPIVILLTSRKIGETQFLIKACQSLKNSSKINITSRRWIFAWVSISGIPVVSRFETRLGCSTLWDAITLKPELFISDFLA